MPTIDEQLAFAAMQAKYLRESARERINSAEGFEAQAKILRAEKAREEAEAKKTVGERTAEAMVLVDRGSIRIIYPGNPSRWMPVYEGANTEALEDVRFFREYIAAAIDKAVADEREAGRDVD